MHPLPRALLLAAGCAVMLGTSPKRPPGVPPPSPELSVNLSAGSAATVRLWMRAPAGVPLTVRPLFRGSNPQGRHARLVGIVSRTPPPADALALLEPTTPFKVDQQVGALGAVSFIFDISHNILSSESSEDPSLALDLGSGEEAFLTLYSPDRHLVLYVELSEEYAEKYCECDIAVDVSPIHRGP